RGPARGRQDPRGGQVGPGPAAAAGALRLLGGHRAGVGPAGGAARRGAGCGGRVGGLLGGVPLDPQLARRGRVAVRGVGIGARCGRLRRCDGRGPGPGGPPALADVPAHRTVRVVPVVTGLTLCHPYIPPSASSRPSNPHTDADGSRPTARGRGAVGWRRITRRQPTPAYECRPATTMLMKKRLKTIVAKPATLTHAARPVRQPAVALACRYAA